MKTKLHIVKIGGNSIDDPKQLDAFLTNFASLSEPKILVHGGGKLATELASKLDIAQTMVDGRRITDAKTLEVTVMVYAGLVNKKIVAKLQAHNVNAMGFCGADGNLIQSKKRENAQIDYGFVGDVLEEGVNTNQFLTLLENGIVPVISPITHNGKGDLFNTNADTMASKIAVALSEKYDVVLTYCFEKAGVLINIEDEESYIALINKEKYNQLKADGIISNGMIPKLDNAFEAIEKGVTRVAICKSTSIWELSSENIKGTQIVK